MKNDRKSKPVASWQAVFTQQPRWRVVFLVAHTACDNLWQPTQPVTTLAGDFRCGFNDPEWLGYDWIGDMENVSN